MTIDLTGLPDEVVQQVVRIVDEARRAEAKPAGAPGVSPDGGGRPSDIGRFAHLGLSFPPEVFEENKREIMETFEKKWGQSYGEEPA
jgi:hypothetical protein